MAVTSSSAQRIRVPLDNRVAGRVATPGSHTKYMRVRVRRFLTVLADEAALFLCHDDRCPALGLSASTLRDKTTDGRVCLPEGGLETRVDWRRGRTNGAGWRRGCERAFHDMCIVHKLRLGWV
jgi:hypothetical protein